jgi:uncharacterized protein (DUF697 family)
MDGYLVLGRRYMLPFILGISAAIGSAITAGEAAAIGATIGAVTVAGVNMLKKNKKRNDADTAGNDDLEEIIKLIVRLKQSQEGGQ